jgi:predicted metal-dependent hydrolase
LALLEDKRAWIEKQIEKNNKKEKIFVNIEDEVLLFGEIYSIDNQEVSLLREKLHRLKSPSNEKILKAYDAFYKERAYEYLTQELQKHADIMQLSFKELKIRKMKRRWGSCNSHRVITLNSELMKLDREFIKYVLIHELAHLVHMNHSKEFHALVENYLPNSKLIRKRLKESRVLD